MEKIALISKHKRIPRAKLDIELAVWERQGLVCGVDEVGRGCLAGPVVTAAIVLHPGATFELLKDSKLLTKEQRERAARWIKEHSWYAYGVVSHDEIDCLNVFWATKCAMKRAVLHVCASITSLPEKIVVDAMSLSFDLTALAHIPVEHFPFAEQRSISVAAASILAKVKRDALMGEFEKLFPGYALAVHKGYATEQHRNCVMQLGRSIIHRKTFEYHLHNNGGAHEQQGSLFCGDSRKLPDVL